MDGNFNNLWGQLESLDMDNFMEFKSNDRVPTKLALLIIIIID